MLHDPETVGLRHFFDFSQRIFLRKFGPYQLVAVEIVALVGVPHVYFLRYQAHQIAPYLSIDRVIMRVEVKLVGFKTSSQFPG